MTSIVSMNVSQFLEFSLYFISSFICISHKSFASEWSVMLAALLLTLLTNKVSVYFLLCPRHEIVEGHVVFTLSVCVFVCLLPESYPTRTFVLRFQNYSAQMTIMAKRNVSWLEYQDHTAHVSFVNRLLVQSNCGGT